MIKTRLYIFRLILFVLPLAALVLLECALRLFNLFPRQPLFREVQQNGKAVYQLNADVGKRYFDAKRVVIPNLYPEFFTRDKTAQTLRIFCLGESSTAGFPFEYQVPFPAQLKTILSRQYPQTRFEVINLGLSAISSYTVLDFIPEVLQKQPDLVILYMGHNEFYGAYGSASTVSLGQKGGFIRLYMQMQKLHMVQMIRSLFSALTRQKIVDAENTTLMEQVTADKKILYGSAKYRQTAENFHTNLTLILDHCRAANVPVMIGTLVANVKDMAPLGSDKKWLEALERLYSSGQTEQAWTEIAKQIDQDSLSADAWFARGRFYLAQGDSVKAKASLLAAKDRDVVRFRASEDFNKIICATAAKQNALLVDLQAGFEMDSPAGLLGKELLCDHVHPNPVGYALMAFMFSREIHAQKALPTLTADYQAMVEPAVVTDLDWDIGLLRIFKLMHRWPFADEKVDYDQYQPHGDSQATRVAREFVFGHHNWVQAHYTLADHYLAAGRYGEARKEYLAIHDYFNERPEPLLKIAAVYEREQDWGNAEKFYQSALPLSVSKGMIYYSLAMNQWKQKKIPLAIQNIQMAIVAPELNKEQRTMAKYNLAGFFIDARRKDFAKRVIQDILSSDPNFIPARKMLETIK